MKLGNLAKQNDLILLLSRYIKFLISSEGLPKGSAVLIIWLIPTHFLKAVRLDTLD